MGLNQIIQPNLNIRAFYSFKFLTGSKKAQLDMNALNRTNRPKNEIESNYMC